MNKILEKINSLTSKKQKNIEYLNKIYTLIYKNHNNYLFNNDLIGSKDLRWKRVIPCL